MEETKEEAVDANSESHNGNEIQSSHENFPWEDWTVLDKEENSKSSLSTQLNKSNSTSSDTSYSEIGSTSDLEEARECIEVLSEVIRDECPSLKSIDDSVDRSNEESDGVSIITESDVDERAGNVSSREVVVYENLPRTRLERPDGRLDGIFMKVPNVVIACSMVAVLGLAAGWLLNIDDNRPVSNQLDLSSMKMESSKLVEQMKELNTAVKRVLEEVKSSLHMDRLPKKESNPLPHFNEKLPHFDSSMNNQDTTIAERLQIFLRTICLENTKEPNVVPKSMKSTCDANLLFSDIKKLLQILHNAVDAMEQSEQSTHRRFFGNIESQINSMSDQFLSDITQALVKSSDKNKKRLEKIGFKLNERLCILRNTLPSDSKHRESLMKNNTYLENCDDIATKKSDDRIKKKWREGSPKSQPLKVEKKDYKKRDTPSVLDFNKKPRRSQLKRQNSTNPDDSIQPTKCNRNNFSSFLHDSTDSEDTCATLMAPPRSNWKLKYKFDKIQSENGDKDKRKKSSVEWPRNILLKGDRGALRIWKTKTSKDLENPKFRKTFVSSNEFYDVKTKKETKERQDEKTRSNAFLTEPPTTNPDEKYKRINPSTRRMKKNFDIENNEFIVVKRRGDDSKIQGSWQFER